MTGVARFGVGLVVGVIAGVIAWTTSGQWPFGLLILIITAAAVTIAWTLKVLLPKDFEETRAHAAAADVDDRVGDIALLLILVGSLASIGILLGSGTDENKALYAGLAMAAVLTVWALLHTLYTARYARVYYQAPEGGIDFNSDTPPRYTDFCYFSFNLGMTYQVSDTNVSETAIRSEVLKHCLFSYIYGTVIIACSINLVLGLVG
ncbi:DUF1345 domain-containing protein [Nocardia huaxiensis]|uniref:DUF1345 domain-containing protein n=1 Tax=Nocardia huaxiensis TaxID=2755382 RepID=A0A7D6V8C8_9NOCA|nr:DUF1345 domain-containing protein [Nocardia huaxiensis]QLY28813.1 DUF1345 domain-containing protein [Nocardia huaxiensis]UFS97710.1 DUF1345 domain-containing protein [Nocardia huaxiensis]